MMTNPEILVRTDDYWHTKCAESYSVKHERYKNVPVDCTTLTF